MKNKISNLHLSLTELRNESRLFKEVSSLLAASVVHRVYVVGLHAGDLELSEKYGEGIEVYRIQLLTRWFQKNLYFQLIKYIELSIKIIWRYRKEKINIVSVHSVGLLPLGVVLKFIYKSKLVYDAHELETEKADDRGVKKYLAKILEGFLLKFTNLVIVVSDSIADWYAFSYNVQRPLVILNAPFKQALVRQNFFRDSLMISEGETILLYQGLLTKSRGVNLILDAFKQRKDRRFVVVFMGYGPLENEIVTTAQSFSNIYFFPAVSQDIVLQYTASADLGIHLIQNTCLNHYYCLPNKLFEYAMAGLPVIVSNMYEMSNLVQREGIGLVISDFSADSINSALDSLIKMDLPKMRSNAYSAACKYAWDHQEEKIVESYKSMIAKCD